MRYFSCAVAIGIKPDNISQFISPHNGNKCHTHPVVNGAS